MKNPVREWRPKYLPFPPDFWHSAVAVFCAATIAKKTVKDHPLLRPCRKPTQLHPNTTVANRALFGEINAQQQAAWRKTLRCLDEQQQEYET